MRGSDRAENRARLLEERKFSVADVAHMLGVCRRMVYKLIHEGELPAFQFGSKIVVPESDLLCYLRNSRVGPRGEEKLRRKRVSLAGMPEEFEHLRL